MDLGGTSQTCLGKWVCASWFGSILKSGSIDFKCGFIRELLGPGRGTSPFYRVTVFVFESFPPEGLSKNRVKLESNILNWTEKDSNRNWQKQTAGRQVPVWWSGSSTLSHHTAGWLQFDGVAVTEMFTRWGGHADDSPERGPSAWGGGGGGGQARIKTTAPTHEWVQGGGVSHFRFSYCKGKKWTQ